MKPVLTNNLIHLFKSTGECIRSLKHECYVRSVAMDNLRIATGDVSGMAYVWSLSNVLNPAMGSGQRVHLNIQL